MRSNLIVFLQFDDASVACETCEELFTPHSPHIALSLNGVDIVTNGSGSHHQLRKLDQRLSLIQSATAKCGGVYLYANQQGCDGGEREGMVLLNRPVSFFFFFSYSRGGERRG
jgi:predicted amidohydrolase